MANFYKDIKLNNVEPNKVLTVGADGTIQATSVNINEIASTTAVENLTNNVTNITNNVTNLQNAITNINIDISNLDNRVASLENATADISARLTNINGE